MEIAYVIRTGGDFGTIELGIKSKKAKNVQSWNTKVKREGCPGDSRVLSYFLAALRGGN